MWNYHKWLYEALKRLLVIEFNYEYEILFKEKVLFFGFAFYISKLTYTVTKYRFKADKSFVYLSKHFIFILLEILPYATLILPEELNNKNIFKFKVNKIKFNRHRLTSHHSTFLFMSLYRDFLMKI